MTAPFSALFERLRAQGSGLDGELPNSSERQRLQQFAPELARKLAKLKQSPRTQQFLPYLLVRSGLGDRGARSFPGVFWESPDIWTAPVAPRHAPAVPNSPGGEVVAGRPNTVYAHVWNLGRAPISGVQVEFYWFNPSLTFIAANAHLIGVTYVDLAPRSSPACHQLVKCPTAWEPIMVNGGHECLLVRVSALGDPFSVAHQWHANADRHVAQRNIAVVPVGTKLDHLVSSLELTRPEKSVVRLHQVGQEAANALRLVAPHLKLDSAVQTHLLGELTTAGALSLPPASLRRQRDQVNDLSSPLAAVSSGLRVAPLALDRIVPDSVVRLQSAPPLAPPPIASEQAVRSDSVQLLASGGRIAALLQHGALLPRDAQSALKPIAPPVKGKAQALRFGAYQGDQLVGGYTLLIKGAEK